MASPLCCWSLGPYIEDYLQFINVFVGFFLVVSGNVVISLTGLITPVGWGEGGVVTPTDRPKFVRSRCVIEVFGDVFVLSRCFFGFFCGCGGFCHRTESDLFLFLLQQGNPYLFLLRSYDYLKIKYFQ